MLTFIKRRRWTLLIIVSLLTMAVFALWLTLNLKRELVAPQPSKLILDRRGRYLGEVPASDENLGYWALPPEIPHKILATTLETEDRLFYDHGGVHLPSILRALHQNFKAGRVISGASTIAMQVARMQSPGSRNIFRKIKEAAEALLLINHHGHNKVLRHYLTIAPYGNRVHGIVRAARYYFDKPIEDLSWLQAAFLAGLPKAPGRMDPYSSRNLHRALTRAQHILRTLYHRSLIGKVELDQALHSDLRLSDKPRRYPEVMHATLHLIELSGAQSGPILRATIDLDVQTRVQRILSGNLSRLRNLGAGNTAGLVVDTDTGEVLAYSGSNDYFDQEARGAIDYVITKRSPGSALKPFVYALALEKRLYTAASELPDILVEFSENSGQAYLPRNITHTFLGPMLFREALANSRNIPALRVLTEVGVEPALAFFSCAGVSGISYSPGQYGLGLVLGNLHVTLEELVALYGVLAHSGEALQLSYFLNEQPKENRRLLSRPTAQMIAHILSDPQARTPSFRRGCTLEYDYAVAVKTGTSQGYRDAWAVGFSDRLLVGVWVGNHDWRRMNRLGGLNAAAYALHRIFDTLMPNHESHRSVLSDFPPPEGYVEKNICALSGKLASKECPQRHLEYFALGTEPYQICPYHRKIKIDKRNGLLASRYCTKMFVEERVLVDLPEIYAPWARNLHLELAPKLQSLLCGGWKEEGKPSVAISEPTNHSRYLWDPDTPPECATIRLSAQVSPKTEEIVWIIDGVPVAKVAHPHEYRWSLQPGTHTIKAAMVQRPYTSRPVTVVVAD